MSKTITNANAYSMAEATKKHVESGKTGLPYSLTYNGTVYYWYDIMYTMAYYVQNPNAGSCEIPYLKSQSSPWTGDTIKEDVKKADYTQQAKNIVNYVKNNNNQMPNYVTTITSKKRVNSNLYGYCFAKILVWYKNHGKTMPNYCTYNSNDVKKEASATPKTYPQQILEYFESKFGKVNTIDVALAKIRGQKYGYYYDDQYTNKQSIDRMKNKQGVNCTDSCQVFWNIGKALGYDVRCIHVKCRGGDGHVKLQFRNDKYPNWFERDPAAILDGECVECRWCTNGTTLAYNPQWFINNVQR